MRIGIISDVHGNYVALRAVMEHMGSVDALWCLGDLVGYGPQPNEVVAAVSHYPHLCVPGNHDWGMLGRLEPRAFNRDARALLEWTREALTEDHVAYLEGLPLTMTVLSSSITLVHASPRDPMWEYLLDLFDAAECFPLFQSRYCFVGHTHVPLIFRDVAGVVKALVPEAGEPMRINVRPYRAGENGDVHNPRMIINPGSVGQPRDGDPRASYMVLTVPDEDTIDGSATLVQYRVEYPVQETQNLMKSLGFPPRMIARLELGI
ncbi:MAG: metallophosphatase family protein [Chloroflexota bacterium]|nr:metallophosphatase family protein [Chloroflexota bacterium]MDQ5866349.1 metallophosphatase family protein [Chloroflexota bacterium]